MTELRNCSLCNSLFSGVSSLCPRCNASAQMDFDIIRDYIYDNPGGNTIEVARATGVKEEVILHFLREGRLSVK